MSLSCCLKNEVCIWTAHYQTFWGYRPVSFTDLT